MPSLTFINEITPNYVIVFNFYFSVLVNSGQMKDTDLMNNKHLFGDESISIKCLL